MTSSDFDKTLDSVIDFVTSKGAGWLCQRSNFGVIAEMLKSGLALTAIDSIDDVNDAIDAARDALR